MVPFFVVDRPISLEIIKGVRIPSNQKIGLMAHANTTKNFRSAFRNFPSEQTIKMCDSAIFHPKRDKNTYLNLFDKYQEMQADYGVIIDVLRDPVKTVKSAQDALNVYNSSTNYSFKLVAVAQGNTIEEFLDCYAELKTLGYEHIAVGGLLHKRERSARYMSVKDEDLLIDVLTNIRNQFQPNWLFVLGCLSPSRFDLFKSLNVWGDYKGWIFEYKKRDDAIKQTINKFRTNHLAHLPEKFAVSEVNINLIHWLTKRENLFQQRAQIHKDLVIAKREVKEFVYKIYQELKGYNVEDANLLLPFRNIGLLTEQNLKFIQNIIDNPSLSNKYFKKVVNLSIKARKLKHKLTKTEIKLEKANKALLIRLDKVKVDKLANKEIKKCALEIGKVLSLTEQDFRISQVRYYIENKILDVI